ncbi:MAG TPA: hypothetical protein VGF71_05895 [Caulobacteraceae bacterium]|jgi:hypothetical protein
MWGRVTIALIAVLGVVLVVLLFTNRISITFDVPRAVTPVAPGVPVALDSNPSSVFWLTAWMFILFSAVSIVAVTTLRFVVRLFRRGHSK